MLNLWTVFVLSYLNSYSFLSFFLRLFDYFILLFRFCILFIASIFQSNLNFNKYLLEYMVQQHKDIKDWVFLRLKELR